MSEVSEVPQADWEVWKNFMVMRRQLERALERQLQSDASLSMPEHEILLTLFRSKDKQLRARDLGETIAWEKSRVSHQVSRMEQRGLVKRVECGDDARGVWVTLTPEGSRAVLGAMRDHTRTIRKYFFDVLSADELATLKRITGNVLDAIDPPACDELDEKSA
ncbi:MAG: MarR family winged helix-turn-helix transcriptional regulator [Rhodoglobus sp.]